MQTVEEQRTMVVIQSLNHKMPELELRDLFAMHALTSFGGGDWNGSWLNIADRNIYGHIERAADVAYRIADAMIERRNRDGK